MAPQAEKGVRGKGRQPFSSPSTQKPRRALARRLGTATLLAHGVATHLDAMSVMNEAVEDSVGGSGIADLFVPAGGGQLRSQNRRTGLITVFADLPRVAAFAFGQRRHGPLVERPYL